MVSFSLSAKLLANVPKLCWKYFIVSIKMTSLPIFAKFIFVGFLPPIEMSLVFQTPALTPFNKNKKSNLRRLCLITLYLFYKIKLQLQLQL